jgi:hypothetical protein
MARRRSLVAAMVVVAGAAALIQVRHKHRIESGLAWGGRAGDNRHSLGLGGSPEEEEEEEGLPPATFALARAWALLAPEAPE